ncbi:hypothetical protein C4J81_16920 [Deltaproteobacteria bacterium Smac51]|nr:hypothetical protein C4J81_16920 [Deltaproteobacteria bacterium Smac51]
MTFRISLRDVYRQGRLNTGGPFVTGSFLKLSLYQTAANPATGVMIFLERKEGNGVRPLAARFKGLGLMANQRVPPSGLRLGEGPRGPYPRPHPRQGASPLEPQEVRVRFNFLLPASPQLASGTKLRQAATLHTASALGAFRLLHVELLQLSIGGLIGRVIVHVCSA